MIAVGVLVAIGAGDSKGRSIYDVSDEVDDVVDVVDSL